MENTCKFIFCAKFPILPLEAGVTMATLKVLTSFNIEVEFEIPEFYRRLLALLIDIVIQFLYFVIASRIFTLIAQSTSFWTDDGAHNLAAWRLLLFVPIMIYHIVLESLMNGQSFGKRIMGLKVVSENGGRASVSQFMIRWLLRISDFWLVILILLLASGAFIYFDRETNFLLILIIVFVLADIIVTVSSAKGQRIGDLLAGTILIRTQNRRYISETVFQEVEDNYTPVHPEIMRLSDKDINAIKAILESARRRNDPAVADSAAYKIQSHLQISTNQDSLQFLETLLKDYNYLSVK